LFHPLKETALFSESVVLQICLGVSLIMNSLETLKIDRATAAVGWYAKLVNAQSKKKHSMH
jgi:hypothetical protein